MAVLQIEPTVQYAAAREEYMNELLNRISERIKTSFKKGESHLTFTFAFLSPKILCELHDFLVKLNGLRYGFCYYDENNRKEYFNNFMESSFNDFLTSFIMNEVSNHPERFKLEIELNRFEH